MKIEKTSINNYKIAVSTKVELLEYIKYCVVNKRSHIVTTLNLQMVALGKKDKDYKKLLQQSDLIIADGMPLVWFSKLFRKNKISERVTGTDLSSSILTSFYNQGYAIIGGINPQLAVEKLLGENAITKQNCMFYTDKVCEKNSHLIDNLVNEITRRKIYFIFLALGVPKQDRFAEIFKNRLPNCFIISVGGAFDLLSGVKKRAPYWMQKIGLEWFWRLLVEPKRLWKRYFLLYPTALLVLISCVFKKN